MVNILKRTRKLQELLWIRCGPGALVLPKDVTKLTMEFNTKIYGGHQGARKFWREMMPRIKFRNPAVPVQVSRHTDEKGPALLHVYTKAAAPTAAPSTDAQPAYTIQMRSSQPSEILDRLIEKTGAVVLKATPAEEQEMADLKEQRERSEADRVLVREKLIKERREAELLKLARGEVPSAA